MDKAQYYVSLNLTHWDQNNLTAILQTTFSNSFLFKDTKIQNSFIASHQT